MIKFEEVVRMWNCRGVTLLRLARRGILHPFEVNGEYFFDEAELTRVRSSKTGGQGHLRLVPQFPGVPESTPSTESIAGTRLASIVAESSQMRQEQRRLFRQSREMLSQLGQSQTDWLRLANRSHELLRSFRDAAQPEALTLGTNRSRIETGKFDSTREN